MDQTRDARPRPPLCYQSEASGGGWALGIDAVNPATPMEPPRANLTLRACSLETVCSV